MSVNMDKIDYLPILEALANGCDPETGEVFPDNSPYNRPQIIRALYSATNDIKTFKIKSVQSKAQKQEANQAKNLPINHGLKWENEDRVKLSELFNADEDIKYIAEAVGRKASSVLAELAKQALLSEEQRMALTDKLKINPTVIIKKSVINSF